MLLGLVFGSGVTVQLLNRVLVAVFRFLAWSVNVRMRVLVRVGVLVSMRVYYAVSMRVLVGVYVRMNVGMRVFVLEWIVHDLFLLGTGEKGRFCGYRPVAVVPPHGGCQIICGAM
jgi:hypothetical protein